MAETGAVQPAIRDRRIGSELPTTAESNNRIGVSIPIGGLTARTNRVKLDASWKTISCCELQCYKHGRDFGRNPAAIGMRN